MPYRAIAWCVLIAAAGCSYDDPAVSDTRFSCDATHACPTGATCTGTSGICLRTGPGHDGIACGTSTCTLAQKCCIDGTNPVRCIGVTESCPGTAAFCDGREDCVTGAVCCSGLGEIGCAESCSGAVCTTNADCPSDEPNCCPDTTADDPYGRCQLAAC